MSDFHNYNRKFFPQTQQLLLPVDMTEWLQPNDEVFIYKELVQNLDLGPFYEHYRKNGEGGKFIDPMHLLGVIFYCYSNGIYSSRKIEEACRINIRCRILLVRKHDGRTRIRSKSVDISLKRAEIQECSRWAWICTRYAAALLGKRE